MSGKHYFIRSAECQQTKTEGGEFVPEPRLKKAPRPLDTFHKIMDEGRDSDFNSFTLISTTSETSINVSSEDSGLVNKLKVGKEWLQKKQAG